MKTFKILVTSFLVVAIFSAGCKTMNKSQKGAVIGTAGGAAVGAVIGKAAGNTAMGAIIGAAAGGVTGAVIGHQMDKQAEEMKKEIPDAEVVRVGEGIVIEFNSKILFGFDQSGLTTDARTNLNKLLAILQKYPDTNMRYKGTQTVKELLVTIRNYQKKELPLFPIIYPEMGSPLLDSLLLDLVKHCRGIPMTRMTVNHKIAGWISLFPPMKR
jgi:hypothetical protein